MAESQFKNVSVEIRHVPDDDSGPFESMNHARAAGHDILDPKTGLVQLGFSVDGAFFPVETVKAGLFFQLVDAARQQQQQTPQE